MKPIVSILVIGLFFNVASANSQCDANEKEFDCSGDDPKSCKGPYEVWTKCGNNSCVKSCATLGLTDVFCRPSCGSGCVCVEGYYRNAKGICVKPQNCDSKACKGPHEVWTKCGNNSCVRDCTVLPPIQIYCRPSCHSGCICVKGYYRNASGICVKPKNC